jgi:sporulation protein YlmC with PRC-barrel domain
LIDATPATVSSVFDDIEQGTIMICKALVFGHAVAVLGALAFGNLPPQDSTKSGAQEEQHFRAKQILGSKVTIDSDMSVGTVDDIVLDMNGNVDYLIVANKDQQLVTVPWDAAAFNLEKRIATVHITPQQYKQVPTYTVEQYPVFSTPTYRTQIYKYYGITPSKDRRVIRRGGTVVVP